MTTDQIARWQARFRATSVIRTQIARHNPARGLAESNTSGTFQVYGWEVASGALHQLTDSPTGKLGGQIGQDGRFVYYHHDEAGNEIGHWVRVPWEGGPPQDITPGLPPYPTTGCGLSGDSRWIGFTSAGTDGFDVLVAELGGDGTIGEPRKIFHHGTLTSNPYLSHDGRLVVVGTTQHSAKGQYNLQVVDTVTGRPVTELWDGPETSILAWGWCPLAGDRRLLAMSNRTGVERPLIWDPTTGARDDLALPDIEGDVSALDWSTDGERILLCHIHQAVQQLLIYDVTARTVSPLKHPRGAYGISTYFGTGEIIAQWQDADHPAQVIALDAVTGEMMRTMCHAGTVPAGRPWRSVTFRSSDGEVIQGWLGVPEGRGPFPTVLETHGGPTHVQHEVFSAGAQTWLDQGFAFLTINYRGSTTFGREFQEQIVGDLGHWEVEDMVAARAWLVQQGIAQPDSVLLTGGSYGGYLTLMALGKYPDLWAGGMAAVAIADWTVQYEDTAATLRGYQVGLLGGTPQEKPEQYAASSPITYAERVAAPVIVFQGRNDTRCPPRPLEMYEAKLRSLGKEIEVVWFEAGHAALGIEQRIEWQEHMLRFARRVLG
ncbi:MAG: prolyl oligopeptidase family serine peptidase [Herpetosiphon sp.]